MPTLRRFIRPTDWESVRSRALGSYGPGPKLEKAPRPKPPRAWYFWVEGLSGSHKNPPGVRRYAEEATANPELGETYLRQTVWFRMLDDPRRCPGCSLDCFGVPYPPKCNVYEL